MHLFIYFSCTTTLDGSAAKAKPNIGAKLVQWFKGDPPICHPNNGVALTTAENAIWVTLTIQSVTFLHPGTYGS